MDYAGAGVPEMVGPCVYIVVLPQSVNSLHKQKTCKGHAGCLADLAFSHLVLGNQ